jgi:hypothetical protein
MEFKGTKGQIKVAVICEGISKGIYLSGENQMYFLAQILTYDRPKNEDLANAILFSKAPEMLEMLNKVNELFIRTKFPTERKMIEYSDKIEKLINEATKID